MRFPNQLKQLMETLSQNAAENLKSGFRKTGIYPLRKEVLGRLPRAGCDVIGVGESFICHLEELHGDDDKSSQPRKKRKKVNIVAGKSVSAKDMQQ